MADIDQFLTQGRTEGASDVHLSPGRSPLFRIDGELGPSRLDPVPPERTTELAEGILHERAREVLLRRGAVDFCYKTDAGRYRVNICHQARGTLIVARVIPSEIFPLGDLGLPNMLSTIPELKSGLVLVTGATGTGKSTTLAALVDRINRTRFTTIITLEDPIEFVHRSKNALVVQREIGYHAPSYADGLRAALRQDPDVILVGELRDRESIALALEASETGHLVFGTLHTRGAAQTVDRILDAFPGEQHHQIRHTLADNLKCVISQELLRCADGRGRKPALEIMVGTPAISQLIREGTTFKIPSVIATNRKLGMQLMDRSLLDLVRNHEVDADDACRLAIEKKDFIPFVSQPDPSILGGAA